MSDAPKGRGRGRGRRTVATTLTGAQVSASPSPAPEQSRSRSRTTEAATPAPEAVDDAPSGSEREAATQGEGKGKMPASLAAVAKPAVKRVASVGIGSSRAGSVGLSRAPSVGSAAGRDRPVGGLLGSTSEFRTGAGGSTLAKSKFRPNMKRGAQRAVESDDEDVKMEDGENNFRRNRGPRPPRAPRQELEMTASGPMAQGPGGPPRAWGPKTGAGASGAAVMAASRAGTLGQMLDDDSDASDLEVDADPFDEEGGVRFKAVDLNDIGTGAGEEEGMGPLVLPRDPKVLKTKIKRLKERKAQRASKEASEKAKREGRVEERTVEDAMAVDEEESGASGSFAPGASLGDAKSNTPADSKESSLALVDDEKEAKDLKDLEEEEKKEIILSEAFEVAPEARGELYMFQFPRKFPTFVPADPSSSADLADLSLAEDTNGLKPDPEAPAPRRKAQPPPWGRFGTRQEKAARWTEEAGRIGELRVHRSGKVTLKINGDLRYEVLPAAQPSFLQEIAVLDHPAPKPSKRSPSSSSEESSSDDSESSNDSDASDRKARKKASKSRKSESSKKDKKPPPPDSLILLGQTSKKFIVVPEIADLLDKVGAQEKQEKDEERRIKMMKAGMAAGPSGAGKKEPKKEGRN
ncbi:hypothetical protein JCM11641_007842 [Rhodosporidiobolus odoratus]